MPLGILFCFELFFVTKEYIDKLTGKVADKMTSLSTNSYSYLHNNWRYDGSFNGYFMKGCFDLFSSEGLNYSTKSGVPYNFQYENSMFAVYR